MNTSAWNSLFASLLLDNILPNGKQVHEISFHSALEPFLTGSGEHVFRWCNQPTATSERKRLSPRQASVHCPSQSLRCSRPSAFNECAAVGIYSSVWRANAALYQGPN